MAYGPNAASGVGSLLPTFQRQVEYAVEAAKKLQRERLKSIEVKSGAVKDFDEYLEVSARSLPPRAGITHILTLGVASISSVM